MQIYIRRAWIHVPKKGLDIFDVNTVFKQVACEAMTAGMRRYAACDTDLSGACLEELIDACDIEIVTSPGTGEENTCRSAAFKPVFGKQVKILFREYGVSVNPALF